MRTALYIITNDLRLNDNAALQLCRGFDRCVIAFIVHRRWFAPSRFGFAPMGFGRWQFLQECVSDLSRQLYQLDQHLHVVYAEDHLALRDLIESSGAQTLISNRQFGYYEQQFNHKLAQHYGLQTIEVDNNTLFQAAGKPWLQQNLSGHYTPFRKQAETETIEAPCETVSTLPPSPIPAKPQLNLPNWLPKPSTIKSIFRGGEAAAWSHIQGYCKTEAPSHYKKTRNALSGWSNSSKFSPWLATGCVSPKQLFHAIKYYEAEHGANESSYWLFFELLWREYFQWSALNIGNRLYQFKGRARSAPKTSFYPEHFKRWCQGNTPYPLVNACMNELSHTGYLSNRGRQIAASCLVNEMNCDWRYGAAWFEHHLLDYDVASNWGNWQYIAGVGADPRGGRHFNIEKQTAQYDPDQQYIKQWAGEQKLFAVYTQDPTGWPIPLSSKWL